MTPQELRYSIFSYALSGELTSDKIDKFDIKIREIDLGENIPFEIPEHWKWSALGLVCEMYTGNSIPESVKKAKYEGLEEGYNYIGTKDVSFEHKIAYENGVRIPVGEGFRLAYKGSVLMCIEGGSAGRKIGILDRDVCFGNKLCMFFPHEILNSYLYYYLQTFEFKILFDGMMTGIIGGVSIKKLKEIPIPIPPFSEQERIVTRIEELLPLIARYEKAWNRLEDFNRDFPADMQKSLLQLAIQGKLVEQRPEEGNGEELYQQIKKEKQALIKAGKIKKEKPLPDITDDEIPFDIPESWKWIKLCDLLSVEPANGFSPKGVEYQTPFKNLTLTATTSGTFRPEAFKYVDISTEIAEKYYLENEDILIQRSNSRELVGTPCIYRNGARKYIYPDLMMRVHLLNEIDTDYIAYALKSPYTRSYFQRSATGTSESMPKINQSTVRNALIPLPPLAEQKRIVAKLEELLPLCGKLK